MNLNSILIGSDDPQRLADYYTALFGKPAWSEGGYTGWQLGGGSFTVGHHDQVTGRNPQPGMPLVLPSLLDGLQPDEHEGLPAWNGEDALYDGRIRVRLRPPRGRPHA